MLRAIGAYLDDEHPRRFCLLEDRDGFHVIREYGGDGKNLQETHLSYAQINQEADRLMRRRRLLGTKYRGNWSLSSTGRQEFLRALGYELDEARAHYILVDEADQSLLVTYSYLDPTRGFQWRKHMAVLHREDVAGVTRAAHGRRGKRPASGR